MASSMQGFTSLSINLDKSKTDLETAKGTNTICAVTPARYSTKKSKADSISNHRAILPLGSLKLK
jgi:hypothetical protein